MKKIIVIWLFVMFILGFTSASEYNGSIDSSDGISTNSLEVTLPCSPASVSYGSVNSATCAITCNTNYTLSSNQCVANGGVWGWGGGGSVSKDVCPAGDTSNSFYDGICSVPNIIIKTLSGEVEWIHATAWDITNSPYSTEFNQAYQFAFDNWITTQTTIQTANMEWELIRSHMAKIMVNYALKLLNKTPNTWLLCEFKDMNNEPMEMKFYAKLAC